MFFRFFLLFFLISLAHFIWFHLISSHSISFSFYFFLFLLILFSFCSFPLLYSFSFHCLCPILVFIHHNKLGFYQFPKEHKSTKSIFPRVIWLLGSISLQIRFTIYYISKILCILLIVVRIVIGTFFIIRICVMYFHGTYSRIKTVLLSFCSSSSSSSSSSPPWEFF